ncbi:MAG: hypothetical protein Kow0069_15020 [Promethearchaeota archaeon]
MDSKWLRSPLRSLWVIARESGVCAFEASFGDAGAEDPPADLVAGLLVAFSAFAEEVRAERIEHVQMANARLVFDANELRVLVLWTDPEADWGLVRDFMDRVRDAFDRKYASRLVGWNGDVSAFAGFSGDVDAALEATRAGRRNPLRALLGVSLKDKLDELRRAKESGKWVLGRAGEALADRVARGVAAASRRGGEALESLKRRLVLKKLKRGGDAGEGGDGDDEGGGRKGEGVGP